MNVHTLFSFILRAPRRIVRGSTILFRLGWLSLAGRFGHSPITQIGGPVVSLTTYGDRLRTVHLAIESIGRGHVLPSRLILWLDSETARDHLPDTIGRLERRGLEVKYCKNYGPHKKYYPFLASQDSFNVPLVTADDDILYPSYWLKALYAAYMESPDLLNCYRANVIALNGDGFAKYESWTPCTSTEPSYANVAGTGAGAIYPPSLMMALKRSGTAFELCCPRSDDIWVHANALRTGYKVRQIRKRAFYLVLIPRTQETALWHENYAYQDGNDRQVKSTYSKDDMQKLRA
jgi:hypothetical protein